MNLLNLSVEGRQTKAEQQLQVINSQIELEKIKLQQIEREKELQKNLAEGQATQQSSKGDTNNLENLIKSVKMMKSENKNKDNKNQNETSIPDQNNFLFNELQYVDVIFDDSPLNATLDSGANSIIINTKYVSFLLRGSPSSCKQMQHVDALSRHPVMLVTSDELTYKIVNAQESDEYIRTIKKLLQEGNTSEFISSNKVLYLISEDQELLAVPETLQVDVIKKAHLFGYFAATKTEELV
ncbi:transposon Tf2-9 polyprotein [Trichonephila clavipes]|nr:transposon Tf2-9 polyprotein [Trichonephila clavipes]